MQDENYHLAWHTFPAPWRFQVVFANDAAIFNSKLFPSAISTLAHLYPKMDSIPAFKNAILYPFAPVVSVPADQMDVLFTYEREHFPVLLGLFSPAKNTRIRNTV